MNAAMLKQTNQLGQLFALLDREEYVSDGRGGLIRRMKRMTAAELNAGISGFCQPGHQKSQSLSTRLSEIRWNLRCRKDQIDRYFLRFCNVGREWNEQKQAHEFWLVPAGQAHLLSLGV